MEFSNEDLEHWVASWKNICKTSNPDGCSKCEKTEGGLSVEECEQAELEIKKCIYSQPEEKYEGEIYNHKGKLLGLFEFAEFFISKYPDDIFVYEPKEIVEIREIFEKILSKRKKKP